MYQQFRITGAVETTLIALLVNELGIRIKINIMSTLCKIFYKLW